MDLAKRLGAAYLVVTAVAVAVNLILTPVYHDGSEEYPVWKVLNWFMAAGVVAALAVSFLRRRALDEASASSLEYVRTAAVFYGAVALTMLFFWEWFWTLNPDSETGDAVTSHLVYFPITDALYTVVALAVGRYLWRVAGGGDGEG